LGKKSGKARADNMTAEKRSERLPKKQPRGVGKNKGRVNFNDLASFSIKP
jgi:hypothetical protein